MAKQGKTTGNLKLRSGPGLQFDPPIAFLVPDTPLEILGEEGDWWRVRAEGKEGYVGKKYVALTKILQTAEESSPKFEGARGTEGIGKGQAPNAPARPAGKPAPAKGITPDPSAVNPASAPPSKGSTLKTAVPKPGQPKPKGPPTSLKKK